MDIEELRVKLVASAEGFEAVISKIKQQLTGLNKEVDRINEKIAGKRSSNKDNDITPKIDSNNLEKQLDNLTSKVSSKTDEMVRKIESKTQGLMEKLAAQADKLANAIGRGVGSIKIPVTRSSGEVAPKTSDAIRTSSPRAPPKTATINTEELKSEISNVEATLDNVNARIELQKAKLAELREAYSMAFNPNTKNKIQDQMLKTEALINNLISKSNKLGFTLADLDVKLASVGGGASETASKINNSSNATSRLESVSKKLKSVFDSINNSTTKLSGKLNTFSGVAKKVGSNISNVASKTKGLFSGLKNLGSSAENCNKKFENMNHGLNNVMRQFFTWMVILPMLMKGLSEMASFLGSALMTNNQFATSLNQIKSNLYTAFMPIYNAILPALNALMSALATATAYIASFFSQLAGTTYDASFKAAQNLQSSIGAYNQQEKAAKKAANALGTAGNAAKKAGSMAKNGLASFDEINKLSEKTPTPAGSGVVTPITPMANMAPIEAVTAEWVKKFKDIMSKIFDPMKEAWANEGKATMDALKYALGSIWDLAKDIGKTFLDIWGNGTGVKVCTDILKLLQTIFNIIGDIAKAFKTAWDNGDLGKQVVQALFDTFDSILKLLISIGETFRDVWNSGIGVEICTNILEILKNVFTIIGQIADSFRNAWNDGIGKQLVTDILNLLNGCLRIIKDISSSFSKAWETNGDTVAKGILTILDDILGTISDIANKWANAWESNGAGDTLMNSLLETLGKILTTIGDIGQGIRESIGKAADTIFPAMIQFTTDVSNGLGGLADGFKTIWDNGGQHLFDGIVQLIAKVGELILKITGGAFRDFGNLFKEVLAPAIGKAADVLGDVVGWLSDLVGKINDNKPLVEGIKDVFEGWGLAVAGVKLGELGLDLFKVGSIIKDLGIVSTLGEIITGIVTAIGGWPILIAAAIIGVGIAIYTHWDEIKTISGQKWEEFTTWIGGVWDNLSTVASTKFENIKTYIGQKWDNAKTDAETKWENIKTTLSQKWDNITITSNKTWDDIKDYVSKKWGDVNKDASDDWETIKTTLSRKWEEVTKTSSDTWDSIKKYISDKWTQINNDAPGLWDTIKGTLSGKWNEISTTSQGVWDSIVTYINTTFSGNWSSAWSNIVKDFGDIWDGLKTLAKKPINAVIGLMNGLISGINTAIRALNKINIKIPDNKVFGDIAGMKFGFNLDMIDSIPALATGGIIDSPTLAMVGEAGKEAVMPLENNTGWIDDLAGKIAGKIGGNNSSGSTRNDSGDVIFMLDSDVIGKIAIDQLRKAQRQGKITVIPI